MSLQHLESFFRSTARIGSLASLAFVSAFVLGDLRNPGNAPTAMEWLGLAFFPGGVMAGLIIAWWRELPGGIFSMLSLAGFYAWHVIESDRLAAGPFFVLLTMPALLFILAALCRWQGKQGEANPVKAADR